MAQLLRIPEDVLAAPVAGANLRPGALRSQLAGGDHLLVFLRHFGCMFCRETVSELRTCSETDPAYPPVLFFFVGSPREGRAFMQRYWPTARAIADPTKRFYAAFGVDRGSVSQMFGPAVWRAKRRAESAGHENGERTGDIWMMPGAFLVRDDFVLWAHAPVHAGDHPEFRRIPEHARGAPAPGA